MSPPGPWVSFVLRPGHRSGGVGSEKAGSETATVDLLARVLPRASAGGEWFAVPMDLGAVEVSVVGPPPESAEPLGPIIGFRELEGLGCRVESSGAPSVLDPSRYPNQDVWDGLPRVLCEATAAAVRLLEGRQAFFALEEAEVGTSVHEMVSSVAGPRRSREVMLAAADWLYRVVTRPTGESRPAGASGPAEPIVVAGARAAHIHVVQLCGPEPSVERLRAEIGLLRRLIDPATT